MKQVLVVDDDAGIRAGLSAEFLRRGWRVDGASCVHEARVKFRAEHALVVTDLRMPDGDGMALMRELRLRAPSTVVILLTAYGSVPGAVEAMRDGACDYLMKPVTFEQLEHAASALLQNTAARGANDREVVGHSPAWLSAMERARQAAGSDADVLIEAESGTGKELVARYIHRNGKRGSGPFVAVNCAAFPENLLESELFGHARGAFTGAHTAKAGKFEVASGGTLLLDEIGEMPLGLQPKLLRALQEREFERLGETRPVRVDLRVIATTNRSLAGMVREGKFRSDLFYRLNVIPLRLPPLRERNGDVETLAQTFIRRYAPGREMKLDPVFVERLRAHTWPGNVRELENLIRRALAMSRSNELDAAGLNLAEFTADEFDLSCAASVGLDNSSMETSLDRQLRAGMSVGAMEKRLYEMTLTACGGNRSRAAEMLGVSLRTVRNKVRSYGLPGWSSYVHD